MLSPKIPVVFVLQILLSPPYSHRLIDKPNLKMEAGRRPHNIVNKPNMNLLMPCSPETQAVLMPPFLPLPCHLVDEFTLRMVVEQCVCDVVNEEETSSGKHSHGNSIAPVPPT
jgi:hypothetical protein